MINDYKVTFVQYQDGKPTPTTSVVISATDSQTALQIFSKEYPNSNLIFIEFVK